MSESETNDGTGSSIGLQDPDWKDQLLAPNVSSIAELRAQMPVLDRLLYLDHAAVSPLPECTSRVMQLFARDFASFGSAHWLTWRHHVERTRRAAASLLQADPENVALAHSTTEGLGWVAEGFPWQSGDNVVFPEPEFPSNSFPWRHLKDRGVEVRMVPHDVTGPVEALYEAMADACDRRTRLVTASWVDYATGQVRNPARLAELAHKAGALFCLDAIQGLGVLPLDVVAEDIDFVAADGHKWMMGPEGAGLFYLKPEHLNRLRMPSPGWNSVEQAECFSAEQMNIKQDASRYEVGTFNMIGIAGYGMSLQMLAQLKPQRTEDSALERRAIWEEAIRRADMTPVTSPDHYSGILSVVPSADIDPARLMKRLKQAGIHTSVRHNRLRLSPHIYNNPTDADRFSSAVQAASRTVAN